MGIEPTSYPWQGYILTVILPPRTTSEFLELFYETLSSRDMKLNELV